MKSGHHAGCRAPPGYVLPSFCTTAAEWCGEGALFSWSDTPALQVGARRGEGAALIFLLGCPPSMESLPSSGLGCRSWGSAAGEELPSYRWELRRGETGPFGCTCFGHVVQGEDEKWRQLVLPRMKPQPQPGSWRRGSPCAQLNLPRMKPLQRRAWGMGGIGQVVAQMSLH